MSCLRGILLPLDGRIRRFYERIGENDIEKLTTCGDTCTKFTNCEIRSSLLGGASAMIERDAGNMKDSLWWYGVDFTLQCFL